MQFYRKHTFHLTFLFTIAIALFLALVLLSSRMVLSHNYILRGIRVADLDLGGITYSEAGDLVDDHFQKFLDSSVEISHDEKIFETSLKDLGASFDIYRTIEKIHELSFGSSFTRHVQARLFSFVKDMDIDPIYALDKEQFVQEIMRLIPAIRKPSNALVYVEQDGTVKVLTHRDGIEVDFDPLYEDALLALADFKVPPRLVVEAKNLHAAYTAEEAREDAALLQALLDTKLTFFYEYDGFFYSKTVNIQPELVDIKNQELRFDEAKIGNYVLNTIAVDMDVDAAHAILRRMPTEERDYAVVEGHAKNGRRLNIDSTVQRLVKAIRGNEFDVALDVEIIQGKIINATNEDFEDLVLLGEGVSNFEGSPEGRDFNIRKGLGEKFHNVIIEAGEEFSFNAHLGPVTYSNGWKDSLAIFGGVNLIPVPGGGLCQVATTVYRAIINSGFPTTERKNHSLYVHYYTAYGDGLDSTIYPGQVDLKFVNDTGFPILIQAFAEGDDGFVQFYGIPDGRKVEMIGPMFSDDVPEEYANRVNVGWNQIKWIQEITRPDGNVEEIEIASTYIKGIRR